MTAKESPATSFLTTGESHTRPFHLQGKFVVGEEVDFFFSEDSPLIIPLRPEWVLVRESYECHSYEPVLPCSTLTL